MKFLIRRALKMFGLVAFLSAGGAWALLLATSSPLPGVRLDGTPLDAGNLERVVNARRDAWLDARLKIFTGPYVTRAPRRDLGAVVESQDGIQRLAAVGRSGNPLVDLPTALRSIVGGVNVKWPAKVDQERLLEFVRRLRRHVERPPIAGTQTRDGQPIAGIPGLTINSMLAVTAIRDALMRDADEVRVATHQTPPPSSVGFQTLTANAKFGTLLGSFRSEYARRSESGRSANIELAATKLDGSVIAPGDTLSFNEVVGERSLARGFQVAPEISNQMLVEGVGGGVCQTAATLHALAFLSAFEILEHRPHSRPMRYVPTGLDTMVWWPDKDLRIRNPYPFPVRLKVRVEPEGAINMAFYGAGRAHPVDWNSDVISTIPAGEKRMPDAKLSVGQERVVQGPIDGLVIRRTRTVYSPYGPRSEEREIRYPPNPRIIAYGAFDF